MSLNWLDWHIWDIVNCNEHPFYRATLLKSISLSARQEKIQEPISNHLQTPVYSEWRLHHDCFRPDHLDVPSSREGLTEKFQLYRCDHVSDPDGEYDAF